jgi:16S rRNA (guanine966-N2)-methyltransferase
MTRVVAGSARGRQLIVPADGTRPTSDRAREALFNSLASRLPIVGARVMDLYAGSGAVGIEALSRGAAHARFIESDLQAADIISSNLRILGLGSGVVTKALVAPTLAKSPDAPYDIVFADPPYATDEAEVDAMLAALVGKGWLAPEAILVVERGAKGPERNWPQSVTALASKRYGAGVLWYGRAR